MAGHSQYANIKHRKDAQDNKRGKVFQKITREISAAVKLNGTNLDSNPKLRTVLEKAHSLNMPKDNINRAISKASSHLDNTKYEEIIYEGYGPASIAIIVHCLTDNKNRTASNIRSYFTKCQGKLGTTNSVQYLFEKVGVLEFLTSLTIDDILEVVVEFEVMNLDSFNDLVRLEIKPQDLTLVTKALGQVGVVDFITNGFQNTPLELVNVDSLDDVKLIEKLLDLLDDDDDVQFIETNLKK